jgi:hypothetical protein
MPRLTMSLCCSVLDQALCSTRTMLAAAHTCSTPPRHICGHKQMDARLLDETISARGKRRLCATADFASPPMLHLASCMRCGGTARGEPSCT